MKKLIISAMALLMGSMAFARTGTQADSVKHSLNVGLHFLTHGEICAGGLPRAILSFNQNGDNVYYGTYYVGGAQPYKSM